MKVSADYRMLALDALRGKWKTAVLTGIAASVLGATISSSSNSIASNSKQGTEFFRHKSNCFSDTILPLNNSLINVLR